MIISRRIVIPIVFMHLTACSLISYDTYYSPNSNGEGHKTRTADTGYEHVAFATGPHDTLLLDLEGLEFHITSNDSKIKIITFGPLILPVIPAVPLWFFSFKNKEKIELTVMFSYSYDQMTVDYQKIELEIDNKRLAPESVEIYSTGTILRYNYQSMAPEEFKVYVPPINVGTKKITIPMITFTKENGWVMDSVP